MSKASESNCSDPYRLNVAAIIQNAAGKIALGERVAQPGAWQFPQGGIKSGESEEQALVRELREELSLERHFYQIVQRRAPYRYKFSPEYGKRGYCGQEQTYFLLALCGPDSCVDPLTAEPEFSSVRWIAPAEFCLNWILPMKREVYRQVFSDFLGVNLV